MRTVLVGNRRLMRHLLAAMLRVDWDVVGILGAAGTSAALGIDLIVGPGLSNRSAIERIADQCDDECVP